MSSDTPNIPAPQTPEEVEELIGRECSECLTAYKDSENCTWIREFNVCLRCEHVRGEAVEEATHE